MLRFMACAALVLVCALAVPAGAATRDTRPPTIGWTTADGGIRAGAPVDSAWTTVTGWAKDNLSGVRSVTVSFCPGGPSNGGYQCGSTGSIGEWTTTRATLTCNATRRSCTWSSATPDMPGSYMAVATARDYAGRVRHTDAIQVIVL